MDSRFRGNDKKTKKFIFAFFRVFRSLLFLLKKIRGYLCSSVVRCFFSKKFVFISVHSWFFFCGASIDFRTAVQARRASAQATPAA